MAQVSVEDIRAALKSADYPATKESLLDVAVGAGAEEDVCKALRSLPVAEYDNIDEVLRSLDTVDATGQADADKAVRARDRTSPGLAEHMRDRRAPRLEAD